jgi:hypothetical protein
MSERPAILIEGDRARLFPVLADTSRENRITSILLSVLSQIRPLAEEVMKTTGVRVGKKATIEAYTEVKLREQSNKTNRPDGLLIISTGKNTWKALIEAKIGKARLDPDQVERYLELARDNDIDAVITISNDFVSRADQSPVNVSKKLLKKTALYHWSWTWLCTQCQILDVQDAVDDQEQAYLLKEIIRFLTHKGTGVERFTQMGSTWKDVVHTVTNNGSLKRTSPEVEEAVRCWYEEERDLNLQLSRHVGQSVETVIERKLKDDAAARLKDGVAKLVDDERLCSAYRIPDSAADIDVMADLKGKTICSSMKLKAPADKKSTKARVNWLLRMLKNDDDRIIVRAHWPGRAPATDAPLSVLRENPEALQADNKDVAPHSLEVLLIESLGQRFAGRRTFIEDLEKVVPQYYDLVGQHLRAWQPAPPKPVNPARDSDLGSAGEQQEVNIEI